MKKKRREGTNKLRNERREVTTDTKEIQEIERKYYNYIQKTWTTWMK